MGRIIRRRAAGADLVEILMYYVREGSPATARRFREQAEKSLRQLADMPGLGTLHAFENHALTEVRFFPLSRPFGVYLIFYRPIDGGIEFLRILHGTRDLEAILADEFAVGDDLDHDVEA